MKHLLNFVLISIIYSIDKASVLVKTTGVSLIVRAYQPGDKEQCRRLWRQLTEWHRQIYQDPTIGGEHPEEYFDKHLAKVGSDNLWVAILRSQVVGLVGLIVTESEAEIEPLIVSKAHRRRGIGKQLVATAIQEARRKRVRYLNIKPVARNINAIEFMYGQGFKNLGCIELFMDFSDSSNWKPGPQIFGCRFDY